MVVTVKHVPVQELQKRIPAKFRKLPRPKLSKREYVTLLVFQNSVEISSAVRHALEKLIPCDEQIIAYGFEFTREALECFEKVNAVVVYFRNSIEWTDESYDRIRRMG
ncbi:hypothetical protein LLG95_07310 [bacterium]|nr:hypothetical protein [bacterium]